MEFQLKQQIINVTVRFLGQQTNGLKYQGEYIMPKVSSKENKNVYF